MFRPSPETILFQKVPLRLIAAVLLILALAVSVLLLFSLQHEQLVVQGLIEGKSSTGLFEGLWQSRHDLIVMSVLLFLLSAIGITAVITFQHDTSTRRTLEEVKGLARNILESIPTGILTVSRTGDVTAVNPSAAATLKRSAEELLGRPYDQAFPEGEMMRIVLDGALRSHRHLEQHDMSYRLGDQAARTIRITSADLTGDDGHPAGVLVLLKDVTDLLDLERRVRVADKLAGLHTLSAGVAHELRNPLSAIDLNLHLLEEDMRDGRVLPAAQDKYLQVLNAETRRLSAILDNFMKFARPGSISLHAIDTHKLVSHIVSLLQYEAQDRRIQLITKEQEQLPSMVGDETEISQVLVNVLVNAFQAMPDGGVCHVIVRGIECDGKAWVEVTVQDSGVGIRNEDLSRLFEPFYTTKTGGSGLGLAIAYRIVQDHQGTIHVTSQSGVGTTVVLRLPAVAGAPAPLVSGR
jgi:PAS domain S-box-containing protein